MSGPPPPPPPPHGENPKTTASGGPGLPPGKYDIFIIPEHSAGSGFLYLPSLKPQWNSFIAGVACTLAAVVMGNSLAPAFRAWWAGFQGIGNMGIMLLFIAVALGAWAAGKQQADGGRRQDPGGGDGGGNGGSRFYQPGGFGGTSGQSNGQAPPPPPHSGPNAGPPPPPPQHEQPRGGPYSSWHQNQPEPEPEAQQPPKPEMPKPEAPKPETPKNTWEKAREETRRREEERKRKEAEQKRKEETARRVRELREKEAREREAREKETREREARDRAQKEKEAQERERVERELRERLEKEIREKAEREATEKAAKEFQAAREREEKERQAAREKEAKERQERLEKLRREREERIKKEKEKEEQEQNARKGSTYAYSAVGEKTSMWPNGKPPAAYSQPASPPPAAKPATASPAAAKAAPSSQPPPPSSYAKSGPSAAAKPSADTEEAYSFRPYDKPKKQAARKKSVSDFSESSWAPSATTTRTTPPPSSRGPYTTNDPDKIVIRAVYGFLNQFSKTPASQLISGVGAVTDGLILRITSAGLFVDDDVRGVAQREWDVKAWTLKLVEVWCPALALASVSKSESQSRKTMPSVVRRAVDRSGGIKELSADADIAAFLDEFHRACDGSCRIGLGAFRSTSAFGANSSSASSSNCEKTGEWKAKGLHLLRITIRDTEGKRYLFVVPEEESWKIAKGLQALRNGRQVRALGMAGLNGLETKNILETLGWG